MGDKCLLYSGFFPGRAERKRVNLNYFVDLGISAYGALADLPKFYINGPYDKLADKFVSMMEVLQAMRELAIEQRVLSPLQAMELWQEHDSQKAYASLLAESDGLPIKLAADDLKKLH